MRGPATFAFAMVLALGCDGDKAPPEAKSNAGSDAGPADTPGGDDTPDPGDPPAAPSKGTEPPGPARDGSDERPTTPPPRPAAPPLDPVPGADTALVLIEARTPVARAGKIVLNVGAEALPGRLSPTLTIGCETPCWQPAVVWPTAGETTVDLKLFRSKNLMTAGGTALGTYRIGPVPVPEAGARTEVVLALGVVDGALQAHAHVRDTGAELPFTKL